MKKIYVLIFSILQVFIFSQSQDLTSLASGNNVGFNAIFDTNHNLYGYVSIYDYGKSSEKTKKFEYVILDKNLNPVENKEFEGDITAGTFFGYMDFNGKIILLPSSFDDTLIKTKDFFTPFSMVIDPKTNTISRKKYFDFDHGKFTEVAQQKNIKDERKEDRMEKREKGFNYVAFVTEIKEGGFLAVEGDDYGNYEKNSSLIKFDENKKELWRYKYNENATKKAYEGVSLLEKDEKNLYFLKKIKDKDSEQYSIMVLDMASGKEIKNLPLSFSKETASNITKMSNYKSYIDNDKTFDDKIVMVGREIAPNYLGFKGFARLIINKEDLTVNESILKFLDLSSYIPNISMGGDVEKGYLLDPRDLFFLKDSSVGILMEKYKPEGGYNAPKSLDLVYVYTDKDFKVKEVKILQKEKTKWANNDYLFSQYLNDGKDVVFFYRDYKTDPTTKEKSWKLFINTLIDGKFKQEEITISEKENFVVYPYVAKEGYILLREINTKEKFNKIRLERLNY